MLRPLSLTLIHSNQTHLQNGMCLVSQILSILSLHFNFITFFLKMSQLWEILQEPLVSSNSLGALLRQKMDGVDRRRSSSSRSLKQRLGFNCCGGPTWSFRSTTIQNNNIEDEDEDEGEDIVVDQIQQLPINPHSINDPDPACSSPEVSDSLVSNHHSMNLAAALAAERELRAAEGGNSSNNTEEVGGVAPGTPFRVSLMRLLAETDGGDAAESGGGCGGGGNGIKEGNDSVCCVCMVRKKGAAFIPCGHTYCRVCSREVWLNRGSCPLCNRSIVEILDIF